MDNGSFMVTGKYSRGTYANAVIVHISATGAYLDGKTIGYSRPSGNEGMSLKRLNDTVVVVVSDTLGIDAKSNILLTRLNMTLDAIFLALYSNEGDEEKSEDKAYDVGIRKNGTIVLGGILGYAADDNRLLSATFGPLTGEKKQPKSTG